jgi:hypothetical protein
VRNTVTVKKPMSMHAGLREEIAGFWLPSAFSGVNFGWHAGCYTHHGIILMKQNDREYL